MLRAKCRHCGSGISWRYPLIELYSGLVFISAFWFLPGSVSEVIFSIFLLESFLVLALIDLEHMILPDSVISAVLIVTIAYGFFEKFLLKESQVQIFSFQNLLTALIWLGVFFCIWFFSEGRWMGLGDAKLVFLIGLIFGPWDSILILYIAILAGAILGLSLLIARRATLKSKLPLGTFISFAASFYIFAGSDILRNFGDIFLSLKLLFK
jgi:prepilin signal peptidase PulO-like enzyme (type II secretory pathway)